MNGRSLAKPILVATLVCGTLDILWATLISLWRGREPAARATGAQARRARLATIAVSSAGSTGLGTCMLYPADSVRSRSSTRP